VATMDPLSIAASSAGMVSVCFKVPRRVGQNPHPDMYELRFRGIV
jgi:hypothetical protein